MTFIENIFTIYHYLIHELFLKHAEFNEQYLMLKYPPISAILPSNIFECLKILILLSAKDLIEGRDVKNSSPFSNVQMIFCFIIKVIKIIKLKKMYEKIVNAFEKRNIDSRFNEETGKIIEILKKLNYFQQISNNYGTDHLLLYVSAIQPMILREGQELMDFSDHYIHLEGSLIERDSKESLYCRNLSTGYQVDKTQGKGFKIFAQNDCKMIVIKKSKTNKQYYDCKILQSQRVKMNNLRQYRKIFIKNQQRRKIKQLLEKDSFFDSLGEFDLQQLSLSISIKQYNQSSNTHNSSVPIDYIGYILSGKIKLNYQGKSPQQFGSKDVSKYNLNIKRKQQHISIQGYLEEGQWIGLEQFLWKSASKSNGKVISLRAKIMWIPGDLFAQKYNVVTNYKVLSNLISLISAKKELFERSFTTRKKKQVEISQILHSKQINEKLISKIEALQLPQQRQKQKRMKQKKRMSNKVIVLPEIIKHGITIDVNNESLKRITKETARQNMFEDEFKKNPIKGNLYKDMKRMEKYIREKSPQKSEYVTYQEKDELKRYESTFFKSIYSKMSSINIDQNPNQQGSHPSQRSTNYQFFGTYKTNIPHFNKSIYNNFKIGSKKRAYSHRILDISSFYQ